MTNVPRLEWTPEGFVAPNEEELLAGAFADIDAAMGGGLNPALETPQGQLASSFAALVGEANNQFLRVQSQIDPAFAEGRWQDAIGRIYFIERIGAQPTVVTAQCVGLAGAVIPAGALAQAADGRQYAATSGGTIPAGGSIDLEFACQEVGPIACPAGTLTQIYQAVSGWDTINNAADGVVGRNTETRAEFHARYAESVQKNARGTVPAVRGEVLAVDGVIDAYVTENASNFPTSIGGVGLAPNSIYVAAVGGSDQDVASAIWRKKSPGTPYNGNTFATVLDTEGYEPPYPSYVVAFQRPEELSILFLVEMVNNGQVPADALAHVQAAIAAAFSGSDGGQRARIGAELFASRYYAVIRALGSWAELLRVKVGSKNSPTAILNGTITDGTLDVTSMSFGLGTLAVGQSIIGSGVLAGTKIAALGTGTGGLGTYVLSKTQSLGFRTLRAAVAASDSVDVSIAQVPTLSDDDVALELI